MICLALVKLQNSAVNFIFLVLSDVSTCRHICEDTICSHMGERQILCFSLKNHDFLISKVYLQYS